jgi:hypothetical protein
MEALPRGVPSCLKKRALLNNSQLAPETSSDYGRKFLALGWVDDALDFFLQARDTQALEELQVLSLETGDVFLLERLIKARSLEVPGELWRQIGEQALALEKFLCAQRAFEKAGLPEKAALARQRLENLVPPMSTEVDVQE